MSETNKGPPNAEVVKTQEDLTKNRFLSEGLTEKHFCRIYLANLNDFRANAQQAWPNRIQSSYALSIIKVQAEFSFPLLLLSFFLDLQS